MWKYKSPIGMMYIRHNHGRYNLEINGMVYGTYPSAVSAADDVFTFTTGCDEWDLREGGKYSNNTPTDIHEWEEV